MRPGRVLVACALALLGSGCRHLTDVAQPVIKPLHSTGVVGIRLLPLRAGAGIPKEDALKVAEDLRAALGVTPELRFSVYDKDDALAACKAAVEAKEDYVVGVWFERRVIPAEKACVGAARDPEFPCDPAGPEVVLAGLGFEVADPVSCESMPELERSAEEREQTDDPMWPVHSLVMEAAKTLPKTLMPTSRIEVREVRPEGAFADQGTKAGIKKGEYYQFFRERKPSGVLVVEEASAEKARLKPVWGEMEAKRGDALVDAGKPSLLEETPLAVLVPSSRNGERSLAGGVGLSIRHSPLAGGLILGAGLAAIGSSDFSLTGIATLESGWRFHLTPRLDFSSFASLGIVSFDLDYVGASTIGGSVGMGLSWLFKSFYLSGDVSWFQSAEVEVPSQGGIEPLPYVSISGPMLRLGAGLLP